MGSTWPKKTKKFCRKWIYKGVWDGSKSMTMENSQKIADKSRDIHHIIFLSPYTESALKNTPSYKFWAVLDHLHFFIKNFARNSIKKTQILKFHPKSLKICRKGYFLTLIPNMDSEKWYDVCHVSYRRFSSNSPSSCFFNRPIHPCKFISCKNFLFF